MSINRIKTESHEEWLALRSKYIGGSDAGSVIGMNPYKGALTLWAEKTGKVKPFEGNVITEVGSYLEALVASMFERETGKTVHRVNATLVNDDYPFACANVDRRIVGENALLECKTTNSAPNMKLFANGEYPESWYAQMTHYLAVTGAERIYLAVLIACREFKVFTLERDEAEIAALMTAEKAFWQHVVDNTPPEVSGINSDSDTLCILSGTAKPVTRDLTSELALLKQYDIAAQEAKSAADKLNKLKNQLCGLLGECEEGKAEGYHIRWTPVTRSTFQTKQFQAANPSIDLRPYYTSSTSRRFDFTKEV